jgi:hypothetical protein
MPMLAERHHPFQLDPPTGEPGAEYHAMARVVKAHILAN